VVAGFECLSEERKKVLLLGLVCRMGGSWVKLGICSVGTTTHYIIRMVNKRTYARGSIASG
jgi:hypothetical protein